MKPIVTYGAAIAPVEEGFSAWIEHVDGYPYVHGRGLVQTSQVVRVGENGEFETRNTIYRCKERE